jgi:transcription elongation factor S-II
MSTEWKWVMYNQDGEESGSGSISTIAETENQVFWKEHWSRHKSSPKCLLGEPEKGLVVIGYKTRRPENSRVKEIVSSLIRDATEQELKRIRGGIMILRRIDLESNPREDAETEESIPESLKKEDEIPLEYMVSCEGSTDDNVNILKLLDREGVSNKDEIPGPTTFAYVRNCARDKLWKILEDPSLAKEAECGILEETAKITYHYNIPRVWKNKIVREAYGSIYKKVWRNLLPEDHKESVKNPKLCSHVKAGIISARDLGSMTPQKLWPEKWRELEETRIMKQIATLERSATASTDLFKCPKCGKRECTYREVQTRSADEPMTAFVLCLVCGNRWKE